MNHLYWSEKRIQVPQTIEAKDHEFLDKLKQNLKEGIVAQYTSNHSMDSVYFSLSSLASFSSPKNSTASMMADQVGGGSTLFNHTSSIPMRHL